jgi:hypothetical protein
MNKEMRAEISEVLRESASEIIEFLKKPNTLFPRVVREACHREIGRLRILADELDKETQRNTITMVGRD